MGISRDFFGGRDSAPPDGRKSSPPPSIHLESPYFAAGFTFASSEPPAHAISLFATGRFGEEAILARVVVDPNKCQLNDFGDRTSCTRIAARTYDVALTRLRAPDPITAGRTLFAITGADMPDGLTLIVYPQGNRVYLKLDDVIVPLYLNKGTVLA